MHAHRENIELLWQSALRLFSDSSAPDHRSNLALSICQIPFFHFWPLTVAIKSRIVWPCDQNMILHFLFSSIQEQSQKSSNTSLITSCEYFGKFSYMLLVSKLTTRVGSHFILWKRIHEDRNNTEVLFWCFPYHKIFKQITLDAECKVPLKFDQFFT